MQDRGIKTGKEEKPVQWCLTTLASAAGNWYSIPPGPSGKPHEMCLSTLHLGDKSSKQSSIIFQPLLVKSSPMGFKSLIFPSCTCFSTEFPRGSHAKATENPQCQKQTEKGAGSDKVLSSSTGAKEIHWTNMGWLLTHGMLQNSTQR